MKRFLIMAWLMSVVLIGFFIYDAQSASLEKEYQKAWCDNVGGQMEVVLPDGARIDCMTPTFAIEFDFGHKWAESVGQALYYALKTGKRPGVVLIVGPNEEQYISRLKALAERYHIKVWLIAK